VAFFVGSHEQRIDGKGRVSVPALFRDVLGKSNTFYAFPSFIHRGIECRTTDYMDTLSTRIDDLDPLSDEQDHLSLAIFGTSHALTPDKDGRVILPGALCQHAEITDQVVFVGTGRSFQLWAPVHYRGHQARVRDRAIADRQALRRRPQANPSPVGPVESGT
jgi:MraZ protein